MSLFTQPGHASAADLLLDDPRVAGAVCIESATTTGGAGRRHSVRVLPEARWLEAQTRHAAAAASRSLLEWHNTYELDRTVDAGIIPDRRAPDGLDAVTGSLLALPHERVRETGCGDGLLLRELAPHCRSYAASDVSTVSLARLRAWLEARPSLDHVQVLRQAAHETGGTGRASLDLVVIDASAQPFPDVDYLVRVLDAGWNQVAPGGHLFLRNVRLLGLQTTGIAAAALAYAPDDMTVAALRQSIHAGWLAQSELALDPALFHRYAGSRGATVSVRLRRGWSVSDPMRTSFDVLLGKAAAGQAGPPPPALLDTVPALRRWLAGPDQGSALLRAQPDARLAGDVATYRLLSTAADSMRAVEVRRLVALRMTAGWPEFHPLPRPALPEARGIDPDAIAALCAASGCGAVILATPHTRDGRFDVLVERAGSAGPPRGMQPGLADGPLDDPAMANHPLLLQSLRKLSQSLHNELARLLPEADMPARILPVTRRDQLVLGAPDYDGSWTLTGRL